MDRWVEPGLPVYRKVAAILEDSIEAGRLRPGTILLEGSLAQIFGLSRTPVKQALSELSDRGKVRRFDGRGFVVGAEGTETADDNGKTARRVRLTAGLLGLDEARPELPRTWAWQRIYETVERELIFHSALGRFRVNEVELARFYKVGRTVAHDVLVQAQSTGLVAKDERLRWYVVPLDEKRVCDLYDLRELVEPKALAASVGRVPPEFLDDMSRRLETALAAYPNVTAAEMDALEHGLHVTCVERGDNREIIEVLKRTRCLFITAKHMLGTQLSYPANEPFMAEHLEIVAAMARGDTATVAERMLAHLKVARPKVIERLAAFRRSFAGSPVPYIG
ncbi:MAG TPA: GntR family transcriptional regulator [Candidatus Cybelea sp.]|nr:GntR family transcriptional regulator [Candidatus Cybelea sp.]